jgi:hypothetical protein
MVYWWGPCGALYAHMRWGSWESRDQHNLASLFIPKGVSGGASCAHPSTRHEPQHVAACVLVCLCCLGGVSVRSVPWWGSRGWRGSAAMAVQHLLCYSGIHWCVRQADDLHVFRPCAGDVFGGR